jgi:hypothetical protein
LFERTEVPIQVMVDGGHGGGETYARCAPASKPSSNSFSHAKR